MKRLCLDSTCSYAPFITIIYFEMTLKNSSKNRTKIQKNSKSNLSRKSISSSTNLQYTVKLTKQAYEEREQTCSYKDYLALITLAAFNRHAIKHIQIDKYKTNTQIEMELLKRWNKLPLEDQNKYENEAIDNDIFHQLAYTRIDRDEIFDDKSSLTHHLSIRKELEIQWNNLADDEKIVHKRVVTNRDIEIKRLL
ncbi:unnamed protein product [Adineta steineri]|uniref:Uncharacterized protein n=1 Tax=Adineta steineri TaxID=433720 RepID=A0A815HE21_9BILA|nr:unnamed protein product [Adineta steineri]CAF3779065.1 unnamed protein product [Adineta steineri]